MTPEEPGNPAGPEDDGVSDPDEAAKSALNRARSAAKAKGLRPGKPGRVERATRRRTGKTSGAGPDERDPQAMGSIMGRFVAERGWATSVSVGSVMGRWPDIVGEQVAEHSVPVSFENDILVIAASSTAWATQLKLMTPQLLARLAEELGDGVVGQVRVQGPTAPSWKRGSRRVQGMRGPRDTYG